MKRKSKDVRIAVSIDGATGFFERVRDHAQELDRGMKLSPEMTISFENPRDMMRVLSAQRMQVLRCAKRRPVPVSTIAAQLKRDLRAVSRDIDLLEQFGLLRSHYQPNPGHGRRRIVEPSAERFQIVATL